MLLELYQFDTTKHVWRDTHHDCAYGSVRAHLMWPMVKGRDPHYDCACGLLVCTQGGPWYEGVILAMVVHMAHLECARYLW